MQISNTHTNLKETAVFHLAAMGLRLMTPEDVVAWCDEVIATHPDPPLAILRASVVKGKKHNEVENELALLEGEFDEAAVLRRLFGKMHEVLAADRSRTWPLVWHLHPWEFSCNWVSGELIQDFYYDWYAIHEGHFPSEEERQQANELWIDEFINFLQKAARGETTEYVRQEYGWEYYPAAEPKTMRKKIPGLIYEALIVGVLAAVAILLVKSQEQADSGFGWPEVAMLVAIVVVYVGVSKWRRKR